MSTGAEKIAAERERQVTEEGYTPEHDVGHAQELAVAASSYSINVAAFLLAGGPETPGGTSGSEPPPFWPWGWEFWKPTGDPVRDLVKAAALIAAAIDSLELSGSTPEGGEQHD